MTKLLTYLYCFISLIILISVLYFNKPSNKENFSTRNKCPDILIKENKHLVLYNSKLAKIPGVNPVKFNNLEDYVEYVRWQQSQNIDCPVLFLQKSFDTQGNTVYKKQPSPLEIKGGLPPISGLEISKDTTNKSLLLDAGHNDPPYNKNSYPSFDPQNQYIWLDTPIDKIQHTDIDGKSPNPMDTDWGGHEFTKSLIDKGYYKDENVKIFIPG